MLDLQGAQARPDPSGGAGQRVGAVQLRGSMRLAAHRLGARALGAPGGRVAALEWSQMASARRAAGRQGVRGRGPQRLREVVSAMCAAPRFRGLSVYTDATTSSLLAVGGALGRWLHCVAQPQQEVVVRAVRTVVRPLLRQLQVPRKWASVPAWSTRPSSRGTTIMAHHLMVRYI